MSDEEKRRRRQRSLAIAALLVAFILAVYLVTIFRIGGNVASP
jgi:hypothetical protein